MASMHLLPLILTDVCFALEFTASATPLNMGKALCYKLFLKAGSFGLQRRGKEEIGNKVKMMLGYIGKEVLKWNTNLSHLSIITPSALTNLH